LKLSSAEPNRNPSDPRVIFGAFFARAAAPLHLLPFAFEGLYLRIQCLEPPAGIGIVGHHDRCLVLLKGFHLLFQFINPLLKLLDDFQCVGFIGAQGCCQPLRSDHKPASNIRPSFIRLPFSLGTAILVVSDPVFHYESSALGVVRGSIQYKAPAKWNLNRLE